MKKREKTKESQFAVYYIWRINLSFSTLIARCTFVDEFEVLSLLLSLVASMQLICIESTFQIELDNSTVCLQSWEFSLNCGFIFFNYNFMHFHYVPTDKEARERERVRGANQYVICIIINQSRVSVNSVFGHRRCCLMMVAEAKRADEWPTQKSRAGNFHEKIIMLVDSHFLVCQTTAASMWWAQRANEWMCRKQLWNLSFHFGYIRFCLAVLLLVCRLNHHPMPTLTDKFSQQTNREHTLCAGEWSESQMYCTNEIDRGQTTLKAHKSDKLIPFDFRTLYTISHRSLILMTWSEIFFLRDTLNSFISVFDWVVKHREWNSQLAWNDVTTRMGCECQLLSLLLRLHASSLMKIWMFSSERELNNADTHIRPCETLKLSIKAHSITAFLIHFLWCH